MSVVVPPRAAWVLLATLIAALPVLSGCRSHASASVDLALEAGTLPDVTGTYVFSVCRERCAAEQAPGAYVTGTLILFADSAAESAALPKPSYERAANGCFSLRKLRDQTDSYLGIASSGALLWARDSTGAITFHLFRSPDAGYKVRAAVRADSLVGVGRSWGAGVAWIFQRGDDYVLGRRTGPPDAATCPVAENLP